MKNWRHYTPGELENQYDNRSAVPGHKEIFRDWERRSRLAREELGGARDLAYGPHPRQRIDLFVPANFTTPAPLHLFLHGGYWQAMGKEFSGFVAEGLVQAGVAVAVAGYRLCPEVSLEEVVQDVRDALAWLHLNGAAHGVNASRVQISGHSAGGHLAAMLWTTDWTQQVSELPANILHSGIVISGLYELQPLLSTRVNDALGLDAPRALALSPALLEPGCRAPLLLAVGEAESEEYHRQSDYLCEKWRTAGVPVEVERLKDHHHFSILDELAGREGVLCKAALKFWLQDQIRGTE
jgi:arylformamidase